MATIKSHSDLEQSRKLAEILPLESADLKWFSWEKELNAPLVPTFGYDKETAEFYKDTKAIYLPCWSLAALLSILPNKIISHETAFEGEDAEGINDIYYKCIESTEDDRYMCRYVGNGYKYKCVADNPVDACYEMIIRLNELNLL